MWTSDPDLQVVWRLRHPLPDEEKFASAVQVYFPGATLTFVEGGESK